MSSILISGAKINHYVQKHCNLSLSFLENLTGTQTKNYIEIEGVKVKTFSKRFPIFQQSQQCYICGKEATHLSVETDGQSETYNINMYGDNDLLFTVDHVIPLSKGGKTNENNLKTCCYYCNIKKGNR